MVKVTISRAQKDQSPAEERKRYSEDDEWTTLCYDKPPAAVEDLMKSRVPSNFFKS